MVNDEPAVGTFIKQLMPLYAMLSIDKFALGMLFLGAGLGGLIKTVPTPLDFLSPLLTSEYLSLGFLIVGVLLIISRQN